MSENKLPEAGGVVYTDVFTEDGYKLCITSRGKSSDEAIADLLTTLHKYNFSPRPVSNKKPSPAPQPPRQYEEDPFADDYSYEPVAESQAALEAQAQTIPTAGRNLGLLEYAPKASETQPGDQFQVEVNEYKATAKKVEFWKSDGQYPTFTQSLTSEYAINKFNELFKGWQPVEDDERHPISPPLILTIITSDKPNKNGNYYRNLEGVRRA